MLSGWHRPLALRLLFFLSVALIPVGLLAVMQTSDLVRQGRIQSNAAFESETRDAAVAEREIIQRAFGKATGLGAVALQTAEDAAACDAAFARFVETGDNVVTAGVIGLDGMMWCSSTGERHDFSGFPDWDDVVARPRPTVVVNPEAPISRRPVVIVSQPFWRDTALAGFVFVSIPHNTLAIRRQGSPSRDFTALTVTVDGVVLAAYGANAEAPGTTLPDGMNLAALTNQGEIRFAAASNAGEDRLYSVSPIVDGTLYVLGSWSRTADRGASSPFGIPPQLFPLIMWLTSLGVIYATVHRLVIRHLDRLRRDMRLFGEDRTLPSVDPGDDVSSEIVEIQAAFATTAWTIVEEEAKLERLLQDKNVLLKEVHHRVKNNLQQISSIINLQMRHLKSREAKAAVRRLQERVLGLATIHRNLYRTESLSQVHSAPMLTELTDQLLSLGSGEAGPMTLDRHFDDVLLYPDQAVPLSLLTAEALTNAIKYMGAGEPCWLRLRLDAAEDGRLTLDVVNSRAQPDGDAAGAGHEAGGIGSSLMRAFARQLDGQLTVDDGETTYSVQVTFRVKEFDPSPEIDEAVKPQAPVAA